MIKKTLSCLIIIFLVSVSFSLSQTYQYYGDRTFGGSKLETMVVAIKADSTHLFLVGSSKTNVDGDKTDPLCDTVFQYEVDNWLLKIDTAFNIIWDKSIGGNKAETNPYFFNYGNSNSIIFSCGSPSDSTCDKSENNRGNNQNDYWIYNIDLNGNKIWDKTYGGSSGDAAPQVIQLNSGSYIICGSSGSPVSGDKTVPPYNTSCCDYWAVKFDSLGNKLWDRVYGGTGNELIGAVPYQFNFNLLPSDGENFLLAGTTNSPMSGDISDTSRGAEDIWIIKIDSTGNKIWDKRFGGSANDRCAHIIHTNDNGYILCGLTLSPQGFDVSDTAKGISGDCWVIKFDANGNKQWDKRYGGDFAAYGSWIEEAPGGGYWISGFVQGNVANDVSEPPYGLQGDYWIFKIDSIGNKMWDKRFGGPGSNYGSMFVIMPDSSIFLFGYADTGVTSVKTDLGKGLKDFWVVHFKYSDNTVGINSSLNPNYQILISPNPSNGIINLNSTFNGYAFIMLYNSIGEKVYSQNITLEKQNTLNFSYLSKGMYFLNVINERYSKIIKFVVQ